MEIAVIGPVVGRDMLLPLLTRYSESISAEANITAAEDLSDLPQTTWNLAFIYICENDSGAYLDFIASHPDCEIVFWAEDDSLARLAMRSHPRDFLLMPFSEEQFLAVMKKCQSWADALRVFTCSGAANGRKLRCVEIQYVECVGHSCTIYCRDEALSMRRGMSEILQQLGPGFLRCHKGFVVNMRCVEEVREKTLLLRNGAEIPLSPAQADNIGSQLRAYRQEFSCFVRGGAAL